MESSKLVEAAAVDQHQHLPHLPPEIISEFLLRLPVRIIFKLCCVSKQWYALITDPIFRASYLRRSKQNPRILLEYYPVDNRVVLSSLDCKSRKSRKLDPLGGCKIMKNSLAVLPCLDLVCLYDGRNMYIWNPATGEHIQLPEYLPRPKRPSCYNQKVAFGYLASAAKYKLLHVRFDVFDKDGSHCEVLTLGSHEQYWKETNRPPLARYHCGTASIHGAAYLVRIDRAILRFDLEREEWTTIEGPKPEDLSRRQCSTLLLTELGGSLCLTDCHMHLGTAIWFLEDYNKGTWVCKYNIDVSPLCAGLYYRDVPLVIEKDGRVLVRNCESNTLYYYDPRSKSFENIYSYSGRGMLYAYVYVESFKSLKF